MCFAIPGKVIEVNGSEVIVDFKQSKVNAKSLFEINVGDYVLVNGGIVVEKVLEEDALEAIKIIEKQDGI